MQLMLARPAQGHQLQDLPPQGGVVASPFHLAKQANRFELDVVLLWSRRGLLPSPRQFLPRQLPRLVI
jgi:hypothetical protein